MAPSREITQEQKQNMKFSEDRMQLLEIIHEMIASEFDRRGLTKKRAAKQGQSLPEGAGASERKSFFRRIWEKMTKRMDDSWWADDHKEQPA